MAHHQYRWRTTRAVPLGGAPSWHAAIGGAGGYRERGGVLMSRGREQRPESRGGGEAESAQSVLMGGDQWRRVNTERSDGRVTRSRPSDGVSRAGRVYG